MHRCDRVLVLRGGRVAALGTWAELLQLDVPELRTFEPITSAITATPSQRVHISVVTNLATEMAIHEDPDLVDEEHTMPQHAPNGNSKCDAPSHSGSLSTVPDSPVVANRKSLMLEFTQDSTAGVLQIQFSCVGLVVVDWYTRCASLGKYASPSLRLYLLQCLRWLLVLVWGSRFSRFPLLETPQSQGRKVA